MQYLQNVAQPSANASASSSLVVTEQKIRDAQNLDTRAFEKVNKTDDKQRQDTMTQEASLLGQLLAPCLTTLGDNREDEDEWRSNEAEEQTICIRSLLSTLLELLNIKKSSIRLSTMFPIMSMNRKEFEEKLKKSEEYNRSVQSVRSHREELALQHLEHRQLFK